MNDLESFRVDVAAFLAASIDADVACRAFGAILPPDLHDRARAWQRHMADNGFIGQAYVDMLVYADSTEAAIERFRAYEAPPPKWAKTPKV